MWHKCSFKQIGKPIRDAEINCLLQLKSTAIAVKFSAAFPYPVVKRQVMDQLHLLFKIPYRVHASTPGSGAKRRGGVSAHMRSPRHPGISRCCHPELPDPVCSSALARVIAAKAPASSTWLQGGSLCGAFLNTKIWPLALASASARICSAHAQRENCQAESRTTPGAGRRQRR